jgi:hypothetical protein
VLVKRLDCLPNGGGLFEAGVVRVDNPDRGGPERKKALETRLNLVGGPDPVPDLNSALRRARIENAERADVVAELRGAEIARLEMLEEQLKPVLAQVPQDCDLFDVALLPSEHPRLFIDMIGFVEMGRNRRLYRFLQDTRHGRTILCETEQLGKVVDAVTDYIARRLIEREQALAVGATGRAASDGDKNDNASTLRPRGRRFALRLFVFLVDLLGAAVLFALIAAAAWSVYKVQVRG